MYSGGFRGGSRGSLEPPSGAKLFHFHGEFQEILCAFRQTNPPFLHLNPLLRNPGSAPDVGSYPRLSGTGMTSLTLCFPLLKCQMIMCVQVCFPRAFYELISPPSEPPGEIMSFDVSPVNYSDK